MKRRFFTILSAMSLMLALGVAGLWVRSCWKTDHLNQVVGQEFISVSSSGGLMWMVWGPRNVSINQSIGGGTVKGNIQLESMFVGAVPKSWQWKDLFRFGVAEMSPTLSSIKVAVCPHWAMLLLLSVMPALWFRRRRRLGPHACASCGYDFRASKGSCPECGAAIPVKG